MINGISYRAPAQPICDDQRVRVNSWNMGGAFPSTTDARAGWDWLWEKQPDVVLLHEALLPADQIPWAWQVFTAKYGAGMPGGAGAVRHDRLRRAAQRRRRARNAAVRRPTGHRSPLRRRRA